MKLPTLSTPGARPSELRVSGLYTLSSRPWQAPDGHCYHCCPACSPGLRLSSEPWVLALKKTVCIFCLKSGCLLMVCNLQFRVLDKGLRTCCQVGTCISGCLGVLVISRGSVASMTAARCYGNRSCKRSTRILHFGFPINRARDLNCPFINVWEAELGGLNWAKNFARQATCKYIAGSLKQGR